MYIIDDGIKLNAKLGMRSPRTMICHWDNGSFGCGGGSVPV